MRKRHSVELIATGATYTLLLTVLLVGCCVLGIAFCDLVSTNTKVDHLLASIRDKVSASAVTKNGDLEPWAKAFQERLETLSRTGLESNTVSFLFQVFSIGLLGTGAYLVHRSHRHMRRMGVTVNTYDGRLVSANRLFENRFSVTRALGALVCAQQLTFILRNAKGAGSEESLIQAIRQAVSDAKNSLNEVWEREVGMSNPERNYLLDISSRAAQQLRAVNTGERTAKLKDVVDLLNDVISLLKETDLAGWYKRSVKAFTRAQTDGIG